MAAWAIAVSGLLIGYTAGNMFIPWVVNRIVSGTSMIGDFPASWALNIVFVWGFAFAVATFWYKAINRMKGW